MKNWKTTLIGVITGVYLLISPRLAGDKTQPPITAGNVIPAALAIALGYYAKDKDVTGGTTRQ